MERNNLYFVLIRPMFLGNIGSVARVLKNFEFQNLRLISPPRNYKDAEARKMAVGAFDLLKKAEVFADLDEALNDIDISVGTTCAYQRACTPLPLIEIGAQICLGSGDKRVAIIFGEERDGMTKEDLERCQFTVTIPTSPSFPSLNIAQAVGIFAYEFARTQSSNNASPKIEELADAEATDTFFVGAETLLHEVGFTKSYNKKTIMTEFRTMLKKAKPTIRELQLMQGVLRKLEQLVRNKTS